MTDLDYFFISLGMVHPPIWALWLAVIWAVVSITSTFVDWVGKR